MGSNLHFFQLYTYFPQFIYKFLKFVEVKYLINHVHFEMWPALSKFSILLSTIRTKLFSIYQYIQNWDFGILVLGCTLKFLSIQKDPKNWDF